MKDLQLESYYAGTYARIAARVDVAMRQSAKPCIGVDCDLDAPCERHARTPEVVERYMRRRRHD